MTQSTFEKTVRAMKNPKQLSDSKAQYFSDLWFDQALDLTSEQQTRLGRAYLKHILGVKGSTINRYLTGESKAVTEIGIKMSGKGRKNDYFAYWEEVSEVTPKTYSADDLEWLTENAGGWGAYDFILTVGNHHLQPCSLLEQMAITAHVFK